MEMQDFRYMLVRYVPDRERMEPINVGIILQGAGRIDFRLNPHAARRKEIDTATFQQWRQYFQDEIVADHTPLFQPERMSPDFLCYLQGICEGSVILSRPLAASVTGANTFDEVIASLYSRLVAPPEVTSPVAASRPAGRFRQIAEERRFVDRGMKRQAHVRVGKKRLWMAYRQVENGELIAFDKVEVDKQISQTANEIERLPQIAGQLPELFGASTEYKGVKYCLLADDLSKPFRDQPSEEFEAMRDDFRRYLEKIVKAGGQILDSPKEVENLADQIDQKLPRLTSTA